MDLKDHKTNRALETKFIHTITCNAKAALYTWCSLERVQKKTK